MVRLTGWSAYAVDSPFWKKKKKFFTRDFPIDVKIFHHEDFGLYCLDDWGLVNFTYELITPQTDTPAFATIPADQFEFVCKKFGLSPTDGVQPATKQAVICSPDGTAAVFFICHVEAVPAVNVTVIDGEVGAVVHDQI